MQFFDDICDCESVLGFLFVFSPPSLFAFFSYISPAPEPETPEAIRDYNPHEYQISLKLSKNEVGDVELLKVYDSSVDDVDERLTEIKIKIYFSISISTSAVVDKKLRLYVIL